MKMTLILMMLLLMGITLCPRGVLFAEDVESSELIGRTADNNVFSIEAVNLTEETEPEPAVEPDDEADDEPAE